MLGGLRSGYGRDSRGTLVHASIAASIAGESIMWCLPHPMAPRTRRAGGPVPDRIGAKDSLRSRIDLVRISKWRVRRYWPDLYRGVRQSRSGRIFSQRLAGFVPESRPHSKEYVRQAAETKGQGRSDGQCSVRAGTKGFGRKVPDFLEITAGLASGRDTFPIRSGRQSRSFTEEGLRESGTSVRRAVSLVAVLAATNAWRCSSELSST